MEEKGKKVLLEEQLNLKQQSVGGINFLKNNSKDLLRAFEGKDKLSTSLFSLKLEEGSIQETQEQ